MKLIERYGAPDQKQIGSVNDLYVDLDTNDVYRCTGIKTVGEECGNATVYASTWGNTEYTWEKMGGSDNMVVTFTLNNPNWSTKTIESITCDKTPEECYEAAKNGTLTARYEYWTSESGGMMRHTGLFPAYNATFQRPMEDGDAPYYLNFRGALFNDNGGVVDIEMYTSYDGTFSLYGWLHDSND